MPKEEDYEVDGVRRRRCIYCGEICYLYSDNEYELWLTVRVFEDGQSATCEHRPNQYHKCEIGSEEARF